MPDVLDGRYRLGLRPSFPSSSSLQSLTSLAEHVSGGEGDEDLESTVLKEIIIASKDRPQLLSRLSSAMVTLSSHSFHILTVSLSDRLEKVWISEKPTSLARVTVFLLTFLLSTAPSQWNQKAWRFD